jgi:hypothetical protein
MHVMITMFSLLPTLPYNAIVTHYYNVCVLLVMHMYEYIELVDCFKSK